MSVLTERVSLEIRSSFLLGLKLSSSRKYPSMSVVFMSIIFNISNFTYYINVSNKSLLIQVRKSANAVPFYYESE